MTSEFSRRNFLGRAGAGLSAAWLSAHWPALLVAADHARHAAQSATPPKLEFFTPEQAVEIDAITARIIPTDDLPGAHEAGVVFFIDRALTTFFADDQKTYREGLPQLQKRVQEMFPGVVKFSSATPEQQDQVLHSFDRKEDASGLMYGTQLDAQNFFDTVRQHTIAGFLIDPDSGGNHDGAGWKVIGREREHMFQPPFGYYDKDYLGWQPAAKETDQK